MTIANKDDLAKAARWLIYFTCRQTVYRENYEKGLSPCIDVFTSYDQQELADLLAESRKSIE
jgi:hypothetical protein